MTMPGQFDHRDGATLSAELVNIKKHWWVLPDWLMALGFVVAVSSLFFFVSSAQRLLGALVAIFCATQVAYRMGVYLGFTHGFRQGHEEGVVRANELPSPPPP